MMDPTPFGLTPALLVGALLAGCRQPARPDSGPSGPGSEIVSGRSAGPANPLKNAYFGETHVHTAYSLDAYIGGARLTPDGAYRFAKGEEVEVGGQRFRLRRPLDFAAVTDHAEYLGEMYSTLVAEAPGHDDPKLAELRGLESDEEREAWFLEYVVKSNRSGTPRHPPFFHGPETIRGGWGEVLAAAARHDDPGHFTTIPAFEWSGAPGGGNLHRNVFFRDANVPDLPLSYIDANREDDLWAWMDGLRSQGMKVLAVPHNSNASKGMMFAGVDAKGRPIDRLYAETRRRNEPLIEMMQIKGNSEVHRDFWQADEFADFENADSIQRYSERTYSKANFVREGLALGLVHGQGLGINPFQYGFVGGTDSHNGTPSNVAEDNFMAGSHGAADGTVELRRTGEVGGWILGKDLNPGALCGVWAPRNTRADIWDAMAARETFATSGPRIQPRFFAGWDLPADLASRTDMLATAYAKGVPMGGELGRAPAAETLRFLVAAVKDPDGANLDRIQVVKLWVDRSGGTHERIHDVAWSEPQRRRQDGLGRLEPVGNTVDTSKATYRNTIGAAQLSALWSDPAFDPDQRALYYVRVLEIPTPRWSTYDAVRAGLPLLPDVPATIQERAWTSPIWYTPE